MAFASLEVHHLYTALGRGKSVPNYHLWGGQSLSSRKARKLGKGRSKMHFQLPVSLHSQPQILEIYRESVESSIKVHELTDRGPNESLMYP